MLAIEAFWLFDGSSFEWRYFICSEAGELMTFAMKTKVLLCITFLEDFSSHLTDTLITLKTDMQTQFWFNTLIVYTYSIIYSIISEDSCIHMQSPVPAGFLLNQPTLPNSFGGHVWHSGTLWFAGGEFLRGKKTDACHEQHMVDFCFYGVKKTSFWMQNPRMLLDEGECF